MLSAPRCESAGKRRVMRTQLELIRHDDHEICFAHRARQDVAWAGAALVVCIISRGYSSEVEWNGLVIIDVLATLSIGALIAALCWRHEVVLDFRSRTWTRWRGFWPRPSIRSGTFADLAGLILAFELHSPKASDLPTWVIRLALRDGAETIDIAGFRRAEQAYRGLSALVTTLRIDA